MDHMTEVVALRRHLAIEAEHECSIHPDGCFYCGGPHSTDPLCNDGEYLEGLRESCMDAHSAGVPYWDY